MARQQTMKQQEDFILMNGNNILFYIFEVKK